MRTFDKVKALDILARHLDILGDKKKDDQEKEVRRPLTTLELSAKIIYLVRLAAMRKKETEQAQLEGKGCNPQF